jgi:hypothetical protein
MAVMTKIPVFGTIAHAYGFAVGNFLRILGIVWAPLAVSITVGLMVTPGFLGNHTPINDLEAIQRQSLRLSPFIFVFSLFIRAMIGVGVTELALGKRSGNTFVYFSLGAPVWRLIGAWLLFLLVMIVIYIGLIIVTAVVAVGGGLMVAAMKLSTGAHAIAVGLLVLFCFFLFLGSLIYIMARLTFLIPPVVVEENKVDLARGWILTRGSFWRICAIGFAIFIPLILIQGAIVVSVYGLDFFHRFADIMRAGFMRQLSEDAMRQQMDIWGAAVRARGLQVWPFMAAVGLVFETFAYGLLYGASAFAYREVNPTPAETRSDPV